MKLQSFIDEYKRSKVDISEHLDVLTALVVSINAKNIWELGTRRGCSTAALLKGAIETKGFVTAVEIEPKPLEFIDEEIRPYFKMIESDDMKMDIPKEPIDFLFIDTSHQYWHTSAELKVWGAAVIKGGVICLHDTVSNPEGVAKPIIEYCAQMGFPYLLDSQQNGLGVIFKL